MEKSKLSRIGTILLIIAASCSLLISIGLISLDDKYNYIIQYCASLSFFAVITSIVLSIVFFNKLSYGMSKSTFKILSILNMLFTFITFALLISAFFTFDYAVDTFVITYTIIIEFLFILSFIFMIVGHKDYMNMNYNEELKRIQMLLEKGCISSEEYERRRKILIKII